MVFHVARQKTTNNEWVSLPSRIWDEKGDIKDWLGHKYLQHDDDHLSSSQHYWNIRNMKRVVDFTLRIQHIRVVVKMKCKIKPKNLGYLLKGVFEGKHGERWWRKGNQDNK